MSIIILLVVVCAALLITAVLGGTSFSRSASRDIKRKVAMHAAEIVTERDPFIFESWLEPTLGKRKPCRVEVYPTHILVWAGRPAIILVRLSMYAVKMVLYQDMSSEGVLMAGLGISTENGRYQFISEGVMAAARLSHAANTLKEVHDRSTGTNVILADVSNDRELSPEFLLHS